MHQHRGSGPDLMEVVKVHAHGNQNLDRETF